MYAHGISQGAITAAQGGKFQHGFMSAAFSSAAGHYTNEMKFNAGKVLASSIVGGTASVIGGGKFANGAITGAYVMLFNHMRHGITPKGAKMMAKLYKHYQLGGGKDYGKDYAKYAIKGDDGTYWTGTFFNLNENDF